MTKYFNKTRLLTLLLSLSLIIPTYGQYTEIYNTTTTEIVASGVIHEKSTTLTNLGWLNLNVLRVNLKDQTTSIVPLYNEEAVTTRKTLSTLSKNEPNLIGAINTDFFDVSTGIPFGPIVDNGKYVTNSDGRNSFSVFGLTNEGTPFIDTWKNPGLSITSEFFTFKVNYKNKQYLSDLYDRVIVFDRNYGPKSPGIKAKNVTKITEVVVDNGIVTDVRYNMEPVDIPANGFVISCVSKKADEAMANFMVGMAVNLTYEPYFNNIMTAVGGGNIIVKEGKSQMGMPSSIKGRNPRSALGITADGSELILVTVDGRSSSYMGLTESELAPLMIKLGAYHAINLDGGGSTEMLVRNNFETSANIENNPSDGGERRIASGLGIVSKAPSTNVSQIKIVTDEPIGIKDGSRLIAIQAMDQNLNPISVDQKDVTLSVTGVKSLISGNRITFKSPGTAIISATYKGVTQTLALPVEEYLYKMEVSPDKIQTGFNRKINIKVSGITKNGYSINILPWDLTWISGKQLGKFDSNGNFITGSTAGETIMRAKFDGIEESIVTTVDEKKSAITSFEDDAHIGGGLPLDIQGISNYSEENEGTNNTKGGKLSYNFLLTDRPRQAEIIFGTRKASELIPAPTDSSPIVDPGATTPPLDPTIPVTTDPTISPVVATDLVTPIVSTTTSAPVADDGLPLVGYPVKLGMQVFGTYGNSHQLNITFKDGKNKTYTVTAAPQINWEGWKYLEVVLPTGMSAPIRVAKLIIKEENPVLQDTGYIVVDDLVSISYPKTTLKVPASKSKFTPLEKQNHSNENAPILKFGAITGYDILKNNETKDLHMTEKQYSEIEKDNVTLITVNNIGGTIRKNGISQWQNLLTLKDRIKTSNLIVSLTASTFDDPLERNLFYKTLSDLKTTNKVTSITVLYPNSINAHRVYQGVDLIGLQRQSYTSSIPKTGKKLSYLTIKLEKNGMTYKLNTTTKAVLPEKAAK